jgi:hypothetical protein
MGTEVRVMRLVGIGLLVFGLVVGGGTAVEAGHNWHNAHNLHNNQIKTCERNGIVYKPLSYCYTSCAPTRACEVDVCFSDGEWMSVGSCKQLDCRKVC